MNLCGRSLFSLTEEVYFISRQHAGTRRSAKFGLRKAVLLNFEFLPKDWIMTVPQSGNCCAVTVSFTVAV